MAELGAPFSVQGLVSIRDSYRDQNGDRQYYRTIDKMTTIRRLFITVKDLAALPPHAFAVKRSQSKNSAKSGKLAFKYIQYRMGENPFTDLVPESTGITDTTPEEQIREIVISGLNGLAAEGNVTLTTNMKSPYANIQTSEGLVTIYDKNADDVDANGQPLFDENGNPKNYYLRNDVELTVTLTHAINQGNKYFQVAFSTDKAPADIFGIPQRGHVWDPTSGATASASDFSDASTGQWG